jgi:transposase
VFATLADPAGVVAHRPGALERARLALGDWRDTRARLAEARMVTVLDDLGLTVLVTTIAGLTPVGAAAILAETGDPARFATGRALVKHAGLCPPRQRLRRPSRQDRHLRARPARPAAGRLAGGLGSTAEQPVMAARFTYLTTREHNRLARQQARTACAAALLRWIHAVITYRVAWDLAIAAGDTPALQAA